MKIKNILLLMFTISVLLLLSISSFADATLTRVVGSVDVKMNSRASWTSASAGTTIPNGGQISTGANSIAVIDLGNGSQVTIRQLTQYTVNSASTTSSGAVSSSGSLRLGNIDANIVSPSSTRSDYTVSTPRGTASVRGTNFYLGYSPDLGLFIYCTEGTVEIMTLNNTIVPIHAGDVANITNNSGQGQIVRHIRRNVVNLYSNDLTPEERRNLMNQFTPGFDAPSASSIQDHIRQIIFEEYPERL